MVISFQLLFLVEPDYVKLFEEFAEKEKDNIFAFITGGKFEEI